MADDKPLKVLIAEGWNPKPYEVADLTDAPMPALEQITPTGNTCITKFEIKPGIFAWGSLREFPNEIRFTIFCIGAKMRAPTHIAVDARRGVLAGRTIANALKPVERPSQPRGRHA